MNKELILTKASHGDVDNVLKIFKAVVENMNSKGIYQWDGNYPTEEILKSDILKEQMYMAQMGGETASLFVLNQEYDAQYDNADWQYQDASFFVIHRFCVNPVYQNAGVGQRTLLMIEDVLRNQNIESIRLDTFSQNPIALNLYQKLGYKKTGEARWRTGLFYLFEKKI